MKRTKTTGCCCLFSSSSSGWTPCDRKKETSDHLFFFHFPPSHTHTHTLLSTWESFFLSNCLKRTRHRSVLFASKDSTTSLFYNLVVSGVNTQTACKRWRGVYCLKRGRRGPRKREVLINTHTNCCFFVLVSRRCVQYRPVWATLRPIIWSLIHSLLSPHRHHQLLLLRRPTVAISVIITIT